MNWMSDQVAAGAKDVNAYGMRLASARPWTRFLLFTTSLACWADDDDMSHETVVGHGQRVPD